MAINKGETVTNLGRGGERGGETEKEMDGEPRLDKDIRRTTNGGSVVEERIHIFSPTIKSSITFPLLSSH